MRYLFRGLIRENGKTVEGAVEAESPEDALAALSNNGIVTEDLTPAPLPISARPASQRASFVPNSAGGAGAPPLPPGEDGITADDGAIVGGARPEADSFTPVQQMTHPGANSSDPIDQAFAAASASVSFDAVAQRYKGKSVWVIDRDKIRRQVATVVDKAITKASDDAQEAMGDTRGEDAAERRAADAAATGDRVRESVAEALKDLFKDTRNIASQQDAEAVAQQRREQQQAAAAAQPAPAAAVTMPANFESLVGRLEQMLGKAETTLERLQVAARRVGSGGGGGGGAGFGPRRMSHIPKPQSDEQNSVLMEIFKSNLKLRDNLKPDASSTKPAADAAPAEAAESNEAAQPA